MLIPLITAEPSLPRVSRLNLTCLETSSNSETERALWCPFCCKNLKKVPKGRETSPTQAGVHLSSGGDSLLGAGADLPQFYVFLPLGLKVFSGALPLTRSGGGEEGPRSRGLGPIWAHTLPSPVAFPVQRLDQGLLWKRPLPAAAAALPLLALISPSVLPSPPG